jgi:integrase
VSKHIWTTAEHGIRYREHPTRRVGSRPDRYYAVRYRLDGRQHEEALGWASEGWMLEKVRGMRDELAHGRRTGGSGTMRERRAAAETERARTAVTVTDLWARYAAEVIAHNKPRTAAEKTRMWRTRVKPAIGAIAVAEVTDTNIAAIVQAPLKFDTNGLVTGGRGQAGNLYRLLHHMFVKALAWRMRPRALGNPLEEVDEPKTTRREKLLTSGEISALQCTLGTAEKDQTTAQQVVAVIRLAILTGARIGELLRLRWVEVRRDEMELHLPDTKTGFSRRPISTAALAVIDSVERMPGIEWVFRAVEDPTKPLTYDTVEKAFRRITKDAGVRCSLHTIRHWFATMTANSVNNPRVGMALTGHKSYAAYMNYVHGDKEQARALAERLATLATRVGAEEPKVVELPDRRLGSAVKGR